MYKLQEKLNDLDTTQSSSYKSIDNNDFANKRDRNDNKNNKNLNLLKTGKLVVSNNNKKKLFYLGRQYCKIFARLGNDKKQQTEDLRETVFCMKDHVKPSICENNPGYVIFLIGKMMFHLRKLQK